MLTGILEALDIISLNLTKYFDDLILIYSNLLRVAFTLLDSSESFLVMIGVSGCFLFELIIGSSNFAFSFSCNTRLLFFFY